MNEQRRRQEALSAIRGEIRRQGLVPHHLNAKDAYAVMDDLARSEPDLRVSCWYMRAKDYSLKAWIREWKQWARAEIWREKEESALRQRMDGQTTYGR